MAGFPLITDAGPEIVQAIYVGASVVAGAIVVGAIILVIAVRRVGDCALAVRNQVAHLRGELIEAGPPTTTFPLDAEQLVRGAGFLSAQWLDRSRRPGDDAIGFERLTLALGRFMGVPLPTSSDPTPNPDANARGRLANRIVLLPYGSTSTSEEAATEAVKTAPAPPRNPGAADEA